MRRFNVRVLRPGQYALQREGAIRLVAGGSKSLGVKPVAKDATKKGR